MSLDKMLKCCLSCKYQMRACGDKEKKQYVGCSIVSEKGDGTSEGFMQWCNTIKYTGEFYSTGWCGEGMLYNNCFITGIKESCILYEVAPFEVPELKEAFPHEFI